MTITISTASSAADRLGVAALRYAVYVTEMGRRQRYADHIARTISEPDDETAIILVAKDGDETVVGTARVHLHSAIPSDYMAMYSIGLFGSYSPIGCSTTTKLIVASSFRRTRLPLRLSQACYDLGISADVCFNFIDCNPNLRAFFTRLGFRQLLPDFEHEDYGRVSPLVLALRDYEHLKRIRSPLLYPKDRGVHASVAFFQLLSTKHGPGITKCNQSRPSRTQPAQVIPSFRI